MNDNHVPAEVLPATLSRPTAGPLVPGSLDEAMKLGEVLFKSGMFADVRSAAQAVVKILAGRELGFGPIASLTDVHIIEGKPSIGAHLRAAAIKRSGRYDYRVLHLDREGCELEFLELRAGKWEVVGKVGMTLKDAVDRGYAWSKKNNALKDNWNSSSDDMLFARCLSKGYRRFCPDLTAGVLAYDPDELDVVELTPPAPAVAEPVQIAPPAMSVPAVEPPVNPTPAATPAEASQRLTDEEQTNLAALAREHGRTPQDCQRLLAILNLKSLAQLTRDRLNYVRTVLIQGPAPIPQVDRIAALVTSLALDWKALQARLQEKYGVPSLAHLTAPQADQVEAALKKQLEQRPQPQPQPAA